MGGITVPTDREICQELHANGHDLSPAQVRTVVQSIEVNANTVSLDHHQDLNRKGGMQVGTNEHVEELELQMMRTAFRDEFEDLMSKVLEPDQAQFLKLRFGLDDGAHGLRTVAEAGKLLGLEPAPAKAFYVRALRKIRRSLVTHDLKASWEGDYTNALA